ncbi:MAG: hypothetical protein HYX82_05345 [Chloroflexi bacterium]|nr:hypothetical protein [Chloroflexota bacterium]
MEILRQIDRIEAIAGSSAKLPLTKRGMVDMEKLNEALELIKANLPSDIKEAQQIIQMRESILNQAQMEARRIRGAAEDDAKMRTQDSQIVKDAQKKVEDIVRESQRKAEAIIAEGERQANTRRRAANDYSLEALHQLDDQLSSILNTVRNGVETLEREKEAVS